MRIFAVPSNTVRLVQLVEHQIVVLGVVGSSPTSHPNKETAGMRRLFFYMRRKKSEFTSMEKFRLILKKEGLKATPQRLAVHEAMLSLVHACADDVAEYIAQNSETRIAVASVYNILENLASLGIYSYRQSSGNKRCYDVNTSDHAHLYDSRAHEFKDIQDEEIVRLVEAHFKGRKFAGYKVDSIEIQLVAHPTRKAAKKTSR